MSVSQSSKSLRTESLLDWWALRSLSMLATALPSLHHSPPEEILLSGTSLPAEASEANPPIRQLFIKGNAALLRRPGLGLVGSRRASAQGLEDAHWFAREAVAQGLVVVSGLAVGIDGAAHRGALAQAKDSTIAVLAHGLDTVYPSRHLALRDAILNQGGLLVSEYPPGTPAQPFQFLHRNRIIALLSRAVCLIEAARGSGALTTALSALELGREVFVVPGSIHSELHGGGHELIRQGAGLVQSPQELFFDLGLTDRRPGQSPTKTRGRASQAPTKRPSAAPPAEQLSLAGCQDDRGQKVWPLLTNDGQSLEQLAQGSQMPVAETLAGLLMLELAGLARRQANGQWVRFDRD